MIVRPPHLILASASPRRRELLALLGMPFEVIVSNYNEPRSPDYPVRLPDYVTELAIEKAKRRSIVVLLQNVIEDLSRLGEQRCRVQVRDVSLQVAINFRRVG